MSDQNISVRTNPPSSVNFHFWKPCNYHCDFCFATFHDDDALKAVRGGIRKHDAMRILEMLRQCGVEKINFVGGEPTLCPYLPELLRHARKLGFVVSIVTNGERLKKVLEVASRALDWVGLSVDSADEAVQARLGRGKGDHVSRSIELCRVVHKLDISLKLNTVVTSLNWRENMSEFVIAVKPERWKVFQVLPVGGQNDDKIEELLITSEQFKEFIERHQCVAAHSITVVDESNEAMTGSYAMIDPIGRFFSNVGGRHLYSRPILQVGVVSAFGEIPFSIERFKERDGDYDFGGPRVDLTISIDKSPNAQT